MRTAEDYLRINIAEARSQWRAVDARQPASGGRQVDFTPVETLMCLAASLLVNHRRYGGSTADRAEQPVPALAALFRRPNSSVLAKMANLDGSRRNGARHEIEVAARLLATPGQLAATYRLLLQAARDSGIEAARLPDFLSLEGDDSDLLLLGQEELLLEDLEGTVQAAADAWATERKDLAEQVTERLLVAAARVGQHRFAGEVLRNHGHACVFCGLSVTTAGERARRILVASHIKPWRTSRPAERLDPRNGLTACPTHDVAFDTGLLMVNGGLRIHLAPDVASAAAQGHPGAQAAFGRPPLAEALLLPAGAVAPGDAYLAWHRDNVYGGSAPRTG